MKINISSSKKALFNIIAIAFICIGQKAFCENSNYSAFFTKRYENSKDLISDIENGKKYLVNNITELQFINLQLKNWNRQLVVNKVLDNQSRIIQLDEEFTNTAEARSYFLNILHNSCLDKQLVWSENDYLLARVNKNTGEVAENLIRSNYPNERVVMLDPNMLPGINTSDGDYDLLPGFSLRCGNELIARKVETKTEEVITAKTVKTKQLEVGFVEIPNPYDPPKNTTTTTTTVGGNTTYNTYNTVNNPAPVVVKNNQNGQMLAMVGAMVIGQVLTTGLSIWSMNQQYKMSRSVAANYTPIYTLPQTYYPTIQGNTGNVYKPIEGNANFTPTVYNNNPIQGNSNLTPSVVVNGNPIQGNALLTNNLVYDPIQGWVSR